MYIYCLFFVGIISNLGIGLLNSLIIFVLNFYEKTAKEWESQNQRTRHRSIPCDVTRGVLIATPKACFQRWFLIILKFPYEVSFSGFLCFHKSHVFGRIISCLLSALVSLWCDIIMGQVCVCVCVGEQSVLFCSCISYCMINICMPFPNAKLDFLFVQILFCSICYSPLCRLKLR